MLVKCGAPMVIIYNYKKNSKGADSVKSFYVFQPDFFIKIKTIATSNHNAEIRNGFDGQYIYVEVHSKISHNNSKK